jgi:signal transduction histidine kinase
MGKKTLAVWISLGLAIFTAGYLFTYQEQLRLDLDRLSHTQKILSSLNQLEGSLSEAVAAARGLMISGEDGQLERYPSLVREIDHLFMGLKEMTAAEPGQQRLLESLQPLMHRRLALLDETVELRRRRGLQDRDLAALDRESAEVGRRIRKIFAALEKAETQLLNPEGARHKHHTQIWLWGLTVGAFLSFSLLLLFLYLLNREMAERRRVEKKLLAHQEDLRSLASQLTLAEERERRRIAGYLHDQVGNNLALANLKLEELQKNGAPEAAHVRSEVRQICRLMRQAIQDAHILTFQLSSPILYELGLEAALEWLLEELAKKHDIVTFFEADGRPKPLNDDVRTMLYQSVSELLVNAVKHARPRNLKVALWREGDELMVSVEDDGAGFKPAEAASRHKRGGFGLFSIRERLKPFGGRLEVESAPGAGAQITLTAPLKSEPQL